MEQGQARGRPVPICFRSKVYNFTFNLIELEMPTLDDKRTKPCNQATKSAGPQPATDFHSEIRGWLRGNGGMRDMNYAFLRVPSNSFMSLCYSIAV